MRWYVIECYEGKDFDVELKLAGAGFEVWRPVEFVAAKRRQVIRGYERVTNYRKRVARFGRYIFARLALTDSVHSAIRNQSGVKGFLCEVGSDAPAAIEDADIEALKTLPPKDVVDKFIYEPQDQVLIGVGSWTGLRAVVDEVDSRGVLKLTVTSSGCATKIVLPSRYVELLARGAKPPKKHGRRKQDQKAA